MQCSQEVSSFQCLIILVLPQNVNNKIGGRECCHLIYKCSGRTSGPTIRPLDQSISRSLHNHIIKWHPDFTVSSFHQTFISDLLHQKDYCVFFLYISIIHLTLIQLWKNYTLIQFRGVHTDPGSYSELNVILHHGKGHHSVLEAESDNRSGVRADPNKILQF